MLISLLKLSVSYSKAVEETIKCHLPAIAPFILAKEKNGKLYDGNKKLMPIEDILSHFHNPRLDEKPKLFYLQHEDRSHYSCNSIILPQILPNNLRQSQEADTALEDLLPTLNVTCQSVFLQFLQIIKKGKLISYCHAEISLIQTIQGRYSICSSNSIIYQLLVLSFDYLYKGY